MTRDILKVAGLLMLWSGAANAQDFRQTFPQISTMSPTGVDMQTGHYVERGVEFTIGPLTVDHDLEPKIYGANDGSRARRHFATSLSGSSWRWSGPGVNDQFVMLGGLQIKFNVGAYGGFFPFDSSNVGWKMVTSGTNYILTNKSGETYTFGTHPSGPTRLLMTKTTGDGHTITNSYDPSGRMKLVTSNRGYAVVFDYGPANVTVCGYNLTTDAVSINSTCAGSAIKATYALNSLGKVTSITDPSGAVVYYQYDASNRLSCVTLPNSGTCRVTLAYGTGNPDEARPRTDQVVRQTTAQSEVWNFDYDNVENFPQDYTPYYGEIRRSYSAIAGPDNYTAFFEYGNGYLKTATVGGGTQTYNYSSNFAWSITFMSGTVGPFYYSVYPSVATYEEGNQVVFTRDLADNITVRREIAKPGSGLPNRGMFWGYPEAYRWSHPSICNGPDVLCDKPTAFIDNNDNRTDYTHDPTHGGLLTETGPAVNGVRPQVRNEYVQRYAWILAPWGGYQPASPPVWLLWRTRSCRTTAASGAGCSGGYPDETITTYDYGPDSGPNNLQVRGMVVEADGQALRTCYGYDRNGRRISETQPNAGLGACP